jgi:predicted Zn-dependent peptidase
MIKYNKTVLSNGIRVVSERIPFTNSVCAGVWVRVGSRYENSKNNGISHFIEHMVFKGSKNRTAFEIAKSIESVGGSINAFTGRELTCYFAHVLSKDLPLALEILSDITGNPLFEPSDVNNEKNVILEEINSIDDTPEELIFEHFQKNLFYKHPLGFSVIGNSENVKRFDNTIIRDFWEKNYTSEKIFVAVSGDVEHKRLIELIEKNFSFSRGKGKLNNSGKIHYNEQKKTIIEKNILQAHICIGNIGVSYREREKYPLMILTTILGGGMSSRLFQTVREKYGLAYSVYSFAEFLFDSGVFGVYAGTDKNKVERTIELIKKEFKKMCGKKISNKEMNRVKSQLTGNLILGLESVTSRMTRLAKMEVYLGRYFTLDEVLKDINSVNTEDVLEMSNKILNEDDLQITILKPLSNKI